jgi:site-specific recombinase XerD
MLNEDAFQIARQEFLAHLRYTKGYSEGTCYGYSSDLNIWAGWLDQAGKGWQRAKPVDVEQFIAWQIGDKKASVPIVSRRVSCLSGFYQWAKRNELAVELKVRDVQRVDSIAQSLRVIGKGNKERSVPRPHAFDQVFGFWLKERPRQDKKIPPPDVFC